MNDGPGGTAATRRTGVQAPPQDPSGAIRAQELIPDVIRRHPEVRPVLDRYGLRGCGGPFGPVETLAYFARAHGVELPSLIDELNRARGRAAPELPLAVAERAADGIYRRFFAAGIAVTLTAGAAWGAWLLLRLAAARSFGAVGIAEVNAHGHAQIFGWVGLFVMGFAYQAFPRFKHASLPHPRLALATFPAYLAGLILRTAGEPFAAAPFFLAVAAIGSLLEIFAVLAFAWIVSQVFRRSKPSLIPSDAYILAATFWFAVQTLGDAAHFWATATAASSDALLAQVALWQVPLRDVQIHGFALLMILGVSQRFLPGMLGMGRVPPARLSLAVLAALNIGLVAEAGGFLCRRFSGGAFWGAVLYGGVVLIAFGSALLASQFGLHRPAAERDRSVKFIRAAYLWLGISLAMLLAFPLYLNASGQTFSHAYFGAARHAVTVGFISLMILGVASKVVPTLNGVDAKSLPPLWLPFLLVNAGCTLRVVFQTLTDFTSSAFLAAGASGVLEVAGIGLWGWHIVRILRRRSQPVAASMARPRTAKPDDIVGRLLRAAPETLEIFLAHGFTALSNPILRSTIAQGVTIRQACRLKGIVERDFIAALDEVLSRREDPVRTSGPETEAAGPFRLELPVLVESPEASERAPRPFLDADETVASLVKRMPGAGEILARHHLDTCCGGRHPLREAARRHGVPLEMILNELERLEGTPAGGAK